MIMQEKQTTIESSTSASTISAATTKPVRSDRPARRGKRWNKAEESEMITLLKNGNTPQKIAAWHQRTPLAIIMRTFKVVPDLLNESDAAHDAKNKDLTEQLERTQSVVDYFIRERMANTTPTIGNSA